MIKYIFFDVAGTLLYKNGFFDTISNLLKNEKYYIPADELKLKHKVISEIIHFPDTTNIDFYNHFNSEFLRSLGILPNEKILKLFYTSCANLKWEKYNDTEILQNLNFNKGIISNFNTTLKSKLIDNFGDIFQHVIVSEELGISKPSLRLYQYAIELVGCSPNECLYIGDSLKLDIEPAKFLGIRSLLIDRDNLYHNRLNTISSLNEILNFL